MNDYPYRLRRVSGVVSTDDIIPARYKHMETDPAKLAPHLFESFLPNFQDTIKPGDVLVCDETFGIGSSREQAVSTLLANGIQFVLAPEFGRIFFRNCWNLALPAIEVDVEGLDEGTHCAIDIQDGLLQTSTGIARRFHKIPPFLLAMREAGGLLEDLKVRMRIEGRS